MFNVNNNVNDVVDFEQVNAIWKDTQAALNDFLLMFFLLTWNTFN